ncbi:MAG: hypothetical protein ACHQEA_04055 [Gaiellales bacterium]
MIDRTRGLAYLVIKAEKGVNMTVTHRVGAIDGSARSQMEDRKAAAMLRRQAFIAGKAGQTGDFRRFDVLLARRIIAAG